MNEHTSFTRIPFCAPGYRFQVLGRFTFEPGGERVHGRKARALLAYLLLREKPVGRRQLAGMLWSERGEAQAQASLRQCLYELKDFAHAEPPMLLIGREQISLDHSIVASDFRELVKLAADGNPNGATAVLPSANESVLAGLNGIDPAFDDWLTIERTQLTERILVIAIDCAKAALKRGDSDGARELASRMAQFDPVNETAARLEMEAASHGGDRDAVRRIWRRIEAALSDELGVAPSPETESLYRGLVSAPPPPSALHFTEHGRQFAALPARDPPAADDNVQTLPVERARGSGDARRKTQRRLLLGGAFLLIAGTSGVLALRNGNDPELAVAFEPARSSLEAGAGETFDNAVLTQFAALAAAQGGQIGLAGGGLGLRRQDRPDFRVKTALKHEGKRLAATVQLISPSGDTLLWSGSDANDPERIEDLSLKIAGDLMGILRCAVEPSQGRIVSGDEGWLRLAFAICREQDSARGVALAQQLVRQYPEQSVGWSLLAKFEMFLAETDGLLFDERDPKLVANSRQHAFKALAIDPRSHGAYTALAYSLYDTRSAGKRLDVVEAGLRANPNSPSLHSLHSLYLFLAGYTKAGLIAAQRAARIDPVSPYVRTSLVRRLTAVGAVDQAFLTLAEGDRLDPENELLGDLRLRMMGEQGDPKAALALYQARSRANGYPPSVPPLWLPVLDWRIDPASLDVAKMEQIAAQEVARDPTATYYVAAQFARVGQIERAFAYLDRSRPTNDGAHFILFWSDAAVLRRDPRFFGLMYRLGLVEVWRQRGEWPDFCSEAGLTYDCREEAAKYDREAAAALRHLPRQGSV